MTSGGFGGAVVAVVSESRVAAAIEAVQSQYRTPDDAQAGIMIERPAAGVAIYSE